MTKVVTFEYTNHHGTHGIRCVIPTGITLAGAKARYYPGQYVLEAHDEDKNEPRSFALSKISNWKEEE